MANNDFPISIPVIVSVKPEGEPGCYAVKTEVLASEPPIDSVPKVRELWAKTNANRTMRTEDRIKQKTSDLHTLVRYLATQKGIPQETIDEAIEILSESGKSLHAILSCYRLQYFPELDAELKELQDCEECLKHFTTGS